MSEINNTPAEPVKGQEQTADVPLESDCECNEEKKMDTKDILTSLQVAALQSQSTYQDEMRLAYRRQGDGAAFDMRLLNGALTNACLTADDPMTVAGLNTAVRTPTTIDHPSAIVGK